MVDNQPNQRLLPGLLPQVLADDPALEQSYHTWRGHAFDTTSMPAVYRELIVIVVDLMLANDEGTAIHVESAIEAGATRELIHEAFRLVMFVAGSGVLGRVDGDVSARIVAMLDAAG